MGLRTAFGKDLIRDVPSEWIFEFYLNLEKLHGQDVKIHSVFKQERTPSMVIYVCPNTNEYKFNDFSSGKLGDAVGLVMYMFDLSYQRACQKINEDYSKVGDKNVKREVIKATKAKLVDYEVGPWTEADKIFWTSFKIGSDLLTEYNVKKLLSLTFEKETEHGKERMKIPSLMMYGYFKKDGSIYKTYAPKSVRHKKFFTFSKYTQGSDQLTYKVPYLVICSSLKDVMAFRLMKFKNAEAIAPASESSMISEEEINFYKSKYEKICVLFDNDEAGILAMQKYEQAYGLPGIVLKMEKDLSDSVREHGVANVRTVLYPLITKVLTGKAKYL